MDLFFFRRDNFLLKLVFDLQVEVWAQVQFKIFLTSRNYNSSCVTLFKVSFVSASEYLQFVLLFLR